MGERHHCLWRAYRERLFCQIQDERKGGGSEKKLLASCTSPGRREAGALGSSPPELCSTIGLVVDSGVPKPDGGSGHGDGHHSVERVGVLRLFLYPKGSSGPGMGVSYDCSSRSLAGSLLPGFQGPDASQDGGLGALKHGGPHTCRVRWRCPAVPPALCGGETALSTAFLCLGCPLAAGQSHVAALVGEWLSNWARVRGVLEKVAADRAGGLSVS